jgi:hypothetical protein
LKVKAKKLFNIHQNSQTLTEEAHKLKHTVIEREDSKLEPWILLI